MSKTTNDGPFPCDDELRERVLAMRAADIVSNAQIASGAGTNKTAVGLYLAPLPDGQTSGCMYHGDILNLERLLKNWINKFELERSLGIQTIPTSVSAQFLKASKMITSMRVIGMILGNSGIGKSRACDQQVETDPSTIRVDVTEIGSDRDEVRDELFKAAGVQRPRKQGGKKMMKMMAVLENKLRGTMRPVLVDDAHRLTRRSIQMFMDIHSRTRSPFIFSALPEFQDKIQTDDQWASRTRMRFLLKPYEDKEEKVNEWRPLIEHMVDQMIKDVNGERTNLIGRAERLARADGHYRTVESRLMMMRYLRESPLNQAKSWCELFDDASEFLPEVTNEN